MHRNRALDVLRAAAVLLVLGRHLHTTCPEDRPWLESSIIGLWERIGWMGVDLFFVLSGFLVSGLLFREYQSYGRISPGRFYLRRGFKIYPAFFVFLITTISIAAWRDCQPFPTAEKVLVEVAFLQSYLPSMWNHDWSLAVEEHFYLLLPLLLLVLIYCRKVATGEWRVASKTKTGIYPLPDPFRRLVPVTAGVMAAVLALRILNASRSFQFETHTTPTHLRIDSLLFGVLLGYFYHFHQEKFNAITGRNRRKLLLAGTLLVAPMLILPMESPYVTTIGFTMAAVASGCALCGMLGCKLWFPRCAEVLAYIGAHSYSIYLWHMPVCRWGRIVAERIAGESLSFEAALTLYVLGSIGVGVMMSILVEYPVLALRDRWFPSRSGNPVAPDVEPSSMENSNTETLPHMEMAVSRPTLSVIIPTFNRSDFVRDCLNALKQSGVADLEVIVVDDGSTDDTEAVVAATNPSAIYLRQANSGPAAARNYGFQHSTGKYVGFLDCDDEWLPGAPAAAVALLDSQPDVGVLFAEARMGNRDQGYRSWIDEGGQETFFKLPHREATSGLRTLEKEPFFRRLSYRNPVFIGAVILRREVFERSGGFDRELCGAADWNLWLRLAVSETFAFWKEPLAIYTKHLDGMSNDQDGMNWEFCQALRKLPSQVPLASGQASWIKQRLRHHLYGYAYRAYNRGDYTEAKRRYADLLHTFGWERLSLMYWTFCSLPFGAAGWIRKFKHLFSGGAMPLEQGARSKAVIGQK